MEEFDENEEYLEEHYVELDKLWDGFHFLLTGFNSDDKYNANKTPERLALYYGILGQETLSNEGIYLLNSDKVLDVVNALNAVNIDKLLDKADFNEFQKADLYPDIWYNEDKDEFLGDWLKALFSNFKQFYQNALNNHRSVLIVIG